MFDGPTVRLATADPRSPEYRVSELTLATRRFVVGGDHLRTQSFEERHGNFRPLVELPLELTSRGINDFRISAFVS